MLLESHAILLQMTPTVNSDPAAVLQSSEGVCAFNHKQIIIVNTALNSRFLVIKNQFKA
jgi:hypothetical protein